MARQVAFLGLGVMGFPMAGHLAAAGHDVTVWNRTGAKASAWAEKHKGQAADTAKDAAKDAEFVFICVGDDPDVRAVAEPALEVMEPGAVMVDHTTASPALAQELAEAAGAKGVGFLDAPISGGQAGAEDGQLTVMCGGEESHYRAAEPIMDAYAKACSLIGPAGSGQLAKCVNQICIAGIVQGLSEGLNFAQEAGLDPGKVIGAISKGAAQSWQMENRWETMVKDEFEFGFAVDWMRKDLRIALDAARENGASLPVAALVDQFYAGVQLQGGARWDTSSLIARLRKP